MIERMRKLNLIALSYERDRTLDVLERTGAAEIKLRAEEEGTRPLQEEGGELAARLASWEEALDLLTREAEKYAKAHNVKDFSANGEISVSYAEFLAARERDRQRDRSFGGGERRGACGAGAFGARRRGGASLP